MTPSRRRYEILATLGRGGFGTVYKAQLLGEGGFKKVVALKVLSEGGGHRVEVARRLRDEARILGLLRHRAVVQVDDLVELDGSWTVVMELVDGVDLGVVVAQGGLPPRPALEVIQEVASALHVAWSALGPEGQPLRIVHRDIKPGNILVGRAGEVKVLDFGIARAEFEDREAVTRSVGFGSPEYMSPERLEWQTGPEGDVYALGCVLYELLLGARFGMSSGHPTRHQRRVEEGVAAVVARLGSGGEGIGALIGQLLAYDPEARPSARALERALDPLIAAAPGGRLRDWAEEQVPRLLAAHAPPAGGALTGRVLVEAPARAEATLLVELDPPAPRGASPTLVVPVEESAAPAGPSVALPLELAPPPAEEETPAPRRARAGPLAAALLLLGIGLGALYALRGDAPPTAPAPPPTPAAAPGEAPATAAPAAEPSPAAEPAPVREEPAATPTKARARPSAAPADAAEEEEGRVSLSGDAEKVELRSGGRARAVPGAVPVGVYEVVATFPGREPMAAGTVNVARGASVTLVCSSSFKRCNQR